MTEECVNVLDRVENLRGLGVELGLNTGYLNQLDEMDYKERRIEFCKRLQVLDISLKTLEDALRSPPLKLKCVRAADDILELHGHLPLTSKGSTDSAVSGMSSPTSSSSVFSPTLPEG